MASTPWIANLLVTSLQLYLDTQPPPPRDEHRTFEFRRDNSNLTITTKTRSRKSLKLLEWQLKASGRSVKAYATDGGISIQIDFLTPARPADLVVGAELQFNELEIALADYVEPPRAKLVLHNYVLGPTSVVPKRNQLPTIYEHPIADQYLRFWKQQETASIMNAQPSSPAEIRSQLGDEDSMNEGSGLENKYSSSNSQAQFATQLPTRYSPKTSRTRNLEEDVHREHSVQKPAQDNHVLVNLPERESLQPVGLQNHGDTASNMGDLTQKQLVVPSSIVPKDLSGRRGYSQDVQDGRFQNSTAQSDGGDISTTASMPDAVLQLLRHWRKECHDGRYVPRRLQSIPKDQVALLESDDRWQPPLVGHLHRPGNVPLGLLNHITEWTDAEADRIQQLSNIASRLDRHALEAKEHALLQDDDDPVISSDGDTESSVCPSWDSSPLRPPANHRALPPDSPTLINKKNAVVIERSTGKRNSEVDEPEVVVETEQAESLVTKIVPPSTSMQFNSRSKNLSTEGSNVATGKSRSPSSTLRTETKTEPKILQRTVQVKRTPYHHTVPSPTRGIPDSSPVVIPGTFDERYTNRKNDLLFSSSTSTGREKANGVSGKGGTAFEVDSSEDEAIRKRDHSGRKQTSRVISNSQATADHPRAQDVVNKNGRMSETNDVRSKRNVEDTQTRPPKRLKLNEQIHKDLIHHDYNVIDEDRTHYRRQFFNKIASKSNATGQSDSSVQLSKLGVELVEPPPLFQQDTTSSASQEANQAEQIGTSDTHASVHQSIGGASSRHKKASMMSELQVGSDLDLFDNFRSNYPTYGGERRQFYAACQLLRRLYSQGKATHPSLWDDFVFRHFHDYRKHLEEVMQNCGNALPYEKFYEECVEQPTHLQRIVKLSHIGNIGFELSSPTPRSFPSAAISLQKDVPSDRYPVMPTQLDRSIPADNPISRIMTTQSSRNRSKQHLQVHEHSPDLSQPHSPANQRTVSQEQTRSQDSRASVKIWLERASGAESPILGTPISPKRKENADVPEIELSNKGLALPVQAPIPEKQKKRRSLPWSSAAGHPSPPSTNPARKESATIPSAAPSTARSAPKARHTTSSSAKKSLNQIKPTVSATSLGLSTPQHRPETQLPPRPETAFTRFARFYGHLHSEKEALAKNVTRRSVDISSWRD